MAFHRGTLRALDELGLVSAIDVVSAVSGGSVFGAAWVCSLIERRSTTAFLSDLVPILQRGFIKPTLLSPKVLKLLLPGFNRSHRLAEVFSDILLGGRTLSDLPERPLLCLNASVLNHGMPGRFSPAGFSCDSVGDLPSGKHSYPETPLSRRNLGFAVAASAAFPFALPTLSLQASELPRFTGPLATHQELHLTDGGILENLGVERLLASGRFGTKHIIVSDAGVAESAWAPGFIESLTSFGAYALTRRTLARLLSVMNDKQNRNMRQLTMRRVGALLEPHEDRRLWFVRVDQTWEAFFEGIPRTTLSALVPGQPPPRADAKAAEVVSLLEANGIDLANAKNNYSPGDGVHANRVGTNFTGLSREDIQACERHAMWQVHACHAVYGGIPR